MDKDLKQENQQDNCVDANFKKEHETDATDKSTENKPSIEEQLNEEIAKLKDTLIRKVADSENLRKRLEKEKSDAVKFANTSIVRDLLPTIDNFEHIIANMPKDGSDKNIQAIFDGILLCQKGLLAVLQKHGITKIDAKPGDDFDHQFHQAMCEVESKDIDAGKIVTVMQNGYVYNDRLLRPTMVSVAKK